MSIPFSRTLAALESESQRSRTWLVGGGLVLLAWTIWFATAPVALYETSSDSRLELTGATEDVAAPVAGLVAVSHLELGRSVSLGEPLLELVATSESLVAQEATSQLAALEAQQASLTAEMTSRTEALERFGEVARLRLGEARTALRELEADSHFASEELRRSRELYDLGLRSASDLEKALALSNKSDAAADRGRLTLERLDQEWQTEEQERRAQLERLERSRQQLIGALASQHKAIERLQHDVERRTVHAPIAGRLATVTELEPGSFVAVGDVVCAILPVREMRAVAYFPPAQAVARIRPGQPARLRFTGFPWAQYGSLEATVKRVAAAGRDDRIRVELELDEEDRAASRIPLEHGLPAQTQIEVERATPKDLVLRALGKVTGPAATP